MTSSKKPEELIIEKLDILIKLIGYQVTQSHKNMETKAVVLSSIGLQPADIAKICGTTPGTISVRLAEMKKKGKLKTKK